MGYDVIKDSIDVLDTILGKEESCQLCVMEFVNRLIDLEPMIHEIEEFGADELLVFLGEAKTLENLKHISIARLQLWELSENS